MATDPTPCVSVSKPTQEELLQTLRRLVGPGEEGQELKFRDEQKPVIDRILNGRDVLAILPTGAGKSVCYQVPALHLPGLTIVITPLLALMEEQVEQLYARLKDHIQHYGCPYPVACLSSEFIFDRDGLHKRQTHDAADAPATQNRDADREEIDSPHFRALRDRIFLDACARKYKFLYVTPERLRTGSFIRFAQRAPISMITVDEAHCISLWGHQFRPLYLEILRLFQRMGRQPILSAFTATATPAIQEDIIRLLRMEGCEPVDADPTRPELRFSVRRFRSQPEKLRALLDFLKKRQGASGFVYCATAKTVDEVYTYLVQNGVWATRYYAKLDRARKEKNMDAFLKNRQRIMVCTGALGMGIDKPDIRFVVHFDLPLSLEDYYQQAGRAGRDHQPAECVLYHSSAAGDRQLRRALIVSSLSGAFSREEKVIRHIIESWRLERIEEYAENGVRRSSAELQGEILNYFQKLHIGEEDVLRLLKARQEKERQPKGESRFPFRPELRFSVRSFPSEQAKLKALLEFLMARQGRQGLICCTDAETAEQVEQYLRQKGIAAEGYYSRPDKARANQCAAFLSGQADVLVCADDPGRKISKADLRFVIHFDLPLSIDDYYRQAARDSGERDCVLYHCNTKALQANRRARLEMILAKGKLSPEGKTFRRAVARLQLEQMEAYAKGGEGRSEEELQQQLLDHLRTFHLQVQDVERLDDMARLQNIDVLYVGRTNIAQHLRKGILKKEKLVVSRVGGKPRTVFYEVTPPPGERLTYFDLMVADAVYTLMQHRVSTIYAKSVMELLSGDSELLLRPERRDEVMSSIRKLMNTHIRIDRSNSADYGFTYRDSEDSTVLEGAFLPLFQKKGQGFGYCPYVVPPLYEYAEILNGQFFSFPSRWLKVEGLPATRRNLAMTHYLLCRIGIMPIHPLKKGAEKIRAVTGHDISFQGIPGLLEDEKHRRARDTQTLWERMLTILAHFQEVGAIAGFEVMVPYQRVRIYRS